MQIEGRVSAKNRKGCAINPSLLLRGAWGGIVMVYLLPNRNPPKRRARVTRARAADNALFMRRGSALIEARPYGFEGQWPDRYLKLLLAIETKVHYYQISAGSPQLSTPRPPYGVSAWDGWNRDTKLPWRALTTALRAILWVNHSEHRYKSLPLHVWTSLPNPPRLGRQRGQTAYAEAIAEDGD